MIRFNFPSAAFSLLFACGLAHAQQTPQVFAGSNGEIEATFSGNNCVVYYGPNGRRKEANANCSRDQINRADRGVIAYRREQGMEGDPGSEAPPGGFHSDRHVGHHPPEVVMDRHGRSHVLVGDACIVYYDRSGSQDGSNDHCSRDDRRTADKAMDTYRREQGRSEHHSSGYAYGIPIIQLRNGNYQATVSGTCTVYFNNRGGLLTSLPECTAAERADASLAVLQYRRDH